jgi:HlyD family secretion protein
VIRSLPGSLLAGALALALLAGCSQAALAPKPASQSATPPASASTSVQVATVKSGGLASTLTYSGNVQARRQVSVVPKVAGRVIKLNVDAGSAVKTGDVLLELDHDTLAAQVAQAEAGLQAAQAKLSSLKAGPRPEQVASAEASLDMARQKLAVLQKGGRAEQVAQAEANLASAQARLDQVKKGATQQERDQAALAVDQAKNALWAAQTSRDGICGGKYTPGYACDSANAQVAAAETGVQLAQSRLDQVKAGATPEQITQAQAAVDTAAQQLQMAKQPATKEDLAQLQDAVKAAEAQLALVKQPVTQQDLDAAQAAVAQAQVAVDLAKLQLAEATIKAPFAGVVSQRLVSEGAMAGPTSPVLSLISTETEVVVNVEEANLGAVKVGQSAMVTATAYPGVEFSATVTGVAPSVDVKSRTSQVRLTPQDAEGKLRDGMFAQVKLSTDGAAQSGLLVPKAAVIQEGGDSVAYVVADGKAQRRVVTPGVGDGEQIQITQGLKAGEQVVISGLSGLRDGLQVAVAK